MTTEKMKEIITCELNRYKDINNSEFVSGMRVAYEFCLKRLEDVKNNESSCEKFAERKDKKKHRDWDYGDPVAYLNFKRDTIKAMNKVGYRFIYDLYDPANGNDAVLINIMFERIKDITIDMKRDIIINLTKNKIPILNYDCSDNKYYNTPLLDDLGLTANFFGYKNDKRYLEVMRRTDNMLWYVFSGNIYEFLSHNLSYFNENFDEDDVSKIKNELIELGFKPVKEYERLDATLISNLNNNSIPNVSKNALLRGGYFTLAQVYSDSPKTLSNVRSLGKVGIESLKNLFKRAYNLEWK